MSDIANPPEIPSTVATDEPIADDVFDVLSVARRRTVLSILGERRTSIDGETLARAVASHERDEPAAAVPDEVVDRIHLRLHHVHLPKLDDAELVTYDRDSGVVETARGDGVPIDVE